MQRGRSLAGQSALRSHVWRSRFILGVQRPAIKIARVGAECVTKPPVAARPVELDLQAQKRRPLHQQRKVRQPTWSPSVLQLTQSASLTLQMSCSIGSNFTSKPRLRHIASITVFSASTSPEMAFNPSDLTYSMIICISVQPSPLPLRSDRSRIAYSPLS